jgi:ornithine carbamoyltransferase
MTISKESIERSIAVRKARRQRILAAPPRSFLEISDLSADEFHLLLQRGLDIKANQSRYAHALESRQVALVFQKTSTRTRVSFETGVAALGGRPLYIDWKTSNFTLASLRDEIRALSRYVDLTVARVFEHEDLSLMAAHSEVPVINGLSDWSHPCQGLADYMTMQEYFGELRGLHVVYVGDGNNVAHSLLEGALQAGAKITMCCPRQYAPNSFLVQRLVGKGLALGIAARPEDAVADADVIYTDTWVSMGEEHLAETKVRRFDRFQVDSALLEKAPAHTLVMHCLPAHRGMEISDDVLDSEQAIVFDQAENRRYVQQALMLWLLSVSV